MIYFGYICDIDGESGLVKVNIPDYDITTEFIPFLRHFAQDDTMSIPVSVNELVVVAETRHGYWVVLGAACNQIDKPYSGASNSKFGFHFKDGTLIEYDKETAQYYIQTTGTVKVKAGKVQIQADIIELTAPVIKLDGAVEVTGELTASAGLSVTGDATGTGTLSASDVKAGGVSLKTHVHPGVTSGPSSTGTPQ